MCPLILGKVTWHPSHGAWAAHYKDRQKKSVTKRVYLKKELKYVDTDTAEKASARYNAARRQAYLEAIDYWNVNDQSSRPRIVVPEGSEASAGDAA